MLLIADKSVRIDDKVANIADKSVGIDDKVANIADKSVGIDDKVANIADKYAFIADNIPFNCTNQTKKSYIVRYLNHVALLLLL
ncbi:hypothetical protein ACQKNB_16965 [Lysinibacillus xylanilyticus]|uniref:hypothetical protein n=1 Tax=Lysinibacillus xylanilyticus TaxID=582475 RepID=UPI003D0526CE